MSSNYPPGALDDPSAPYNYDYDDDPPRDEVEFDFWMEDGMVHDRRRPCGCKWRGSYQIDRDVDPQDAEDDIEALFVAPAFLADGYTWRLGDCRNPWKTPEHWGLRDDEIMRIGLDALYALRAEQAQGAAEWAAMHAEDGWLRRVS